MMVYQTLRTFYIIIPGSPCLSHTVEGTGQNLQNTLLTNIDCLKAVSGLIKIIKFTKCI